MSPYRGKWLQTRFGQFGHHLVMMVVLYLTRGGCMDKSKGQFTWDPKVPSPTIVSKSQLLSLKKPSKFGY